MQNFQIVQVSKLEKLRKFKTIKKYDNPVNIFGSHSIGIYNLYTFHQSSIKIITFSKNHKENNLTKNHKYLLYLKNKNINPHIQSMSGIIDGELIYYKPHSQNTSAHSSGYSKDHPQQSSRICDRKEILTHLRTFLATLTSEYLIQKCPQSQNDKISLKIIFHAFFLKNSTFLVSLAINLQVNIVQISISLMDEKGPYQIETLNRRILFCKLFSKSYFEQQNKFMIDLHTGAFKIIRSSVMSFEEGFTDILKPKNKSDNLSIIINNAVKDSVRMFRVILKELNSDSSFQTISKSNNQAELLRLLNRYIIKSPIEPAFDVSFETGKFDKIEIKTKAEIYLTARMMQNIVTDLDQFDTHSFYITPDYPLKYLNKSYTKEFFESNEGQSAFLKDKIIPPPIPPKFNQAFNSRYVFNLIEFNQLFQIKMKKFNSGGFSDISRAEVQFWYLMTLNNQTMQKIQLFNKQRFAQSKTVNKAKRLTRKQMVFKSNTFRCEPGRNRIMHENKIVSKFKGVQSVFLPEYYKVRNQKSPFSQYLLMEFLAYPTLNEYCDASQWSMSFLTKVHLASLIMQSIRFLSSYEIVHLDLKPSNIIVTRRLITKLIDFGQSYHKSVCDKHFKPAFSMPYGSPQIFDGVGKTQFSEKNDVYSWGVIVYELLFKRLPYFFSRQKANQVFKEKKYMDYLYYVPEQEPNYGSAEIMSILRNVIFRALDKNPANRPCTIWLTVLLKECLSYLISIDFNKTET